MCLRADQGCQLLGNGSVSSQRLPGGLHTLIAQASRFAGLHHRMCSTCTSKLTKLMPMQTFTDAFADQPAGQPTLVVATELPKLKESHTPSSWQDRGSTSFGRGGRGSFGGRGSRGGGSSGYSGPRNTSGGSRHCCCVTFVPHEVHAC